MTEYKIINLPEIVIIGIEGLCTPGNNISAELWKEANSRFAEVAELGLKEKDGSYRGFWGAMSDESRSFLPWTENFSRGLYLAGIEADKGAITPDGWTKWTLPARTYLVADVTPDKYIDVFNEVIRSVIPDTGKKLSGAACDFTEPATGRSKLYFPID